MILRSVELENFGKFRGQVFELRRGMNLVIGPNEAGKSTFVEAIPAVLFGTREAERYKPWGRNACAAKLIFEGKDRTVEVRRDLLTDDVHLVERDDLYHTLAEFKGRVAVRGRGAVFQEYRELLSRLLGVGDEDLFRATCFFGHRPQEWSGEELAQKLRALIGSGGGEGDYAEIMDGLLAEHFDLTRVNPWGRDKQRDRELEDLAAKVSALEAAQPAIPSGGGDPASPQADRLRALAAEIERDRIEYEKGVRYVEQIRQKVRQLEAPPSEAPPAAEPENASPAKAEGGIRSRLAAAGLPDNLPEDLPAILAQATEIRQELAQLRQPFASLQQKEGRIIGVPWLLLGGLTLLCVLLGAAAWWLEFAPLWSSAACATAAIGLWSWGAWRQVRRSRMRAICEQERKRLEQKRALAQDRQAALSERCEALGLPSSAVDLVRLQKQVDQHRALLEQFWKGRTESDGSGPEPSAAPSEPSPSPASPRDQESVALRHELRELEKRLEKFAADLTRREKDLRTLQEERQAAPPGAGAGNQELAEARQRKAAVERRVAVLREAIELLAEAVEAFARSDLGKLVEEVSRLFGKVTRGRYREVRLDADMHPQIKIDDRRWQPVERFSRGTVDALYLALRVALARVRGDGRSLPLMLDDPFAHLDQKRLASALNMIDLAAAEGQLILLSHNQELARRAARERWHVVALGDESAEAGIEEGEDHAGQLHLL